MTKLTPHSQSEPWSELLAGYILGDLNPAEIAIVEEYLTQHPAQQAEVDSLRLSLDLLPLSLSADLPATALRKQIMQSVEAETMINAASIPPIAVVVRPFIWWQKAITYRWRIGLSGLGLLLSAGFGWQHYHLSQELATVRQELVNTQVAQSQQHDRLTQDYQSVINVLQQPHNRFVTLRSMGKKTMGNGNLVMAPQQSAAVLTLQQVPPIPAGQVYRVWAIMDDEEMACADFLPDAAGKVLLQIPFASWDKTQKVMITIEDKSATHAAGEIAIESDGQI
jgi:Anti-sigma-K factor rskA